MFSEPSRRPILKEVVKIQERDRHVDRRATPASVRVVLDESLAELEKRGVAIEPAPVTELHGEGDRLSAAELGDGRTSPVDALYIGPRTRLNSRIAEQLGCDMEEVPLGLIIRTDDQKTGSPAWERLEP